MAVALRIEAIIAAVDRITRPLSRMQRAVGAWASSVQGRMESVDRVTSKVAQTIGRGLKIALASVAAGAGALGLATTALANDLDELAKQSRRFDFPIEELQKWKFVAGQSGVESEKFSDALKDFTKNIGEARRGTGALKGGLEKTNPTLLKQLKTTNNTADAFALYIRAMRDAGRATDRVAMAQFAFGESGTFLTNITHSSEEAIKSLMKQQERNGVVTMQQAHMAELYNDAMDSLKRSIGGFMQSVLVPLLPIATVLMKRLREWVVANKAIIATRVKEWAVGLVTNFREIVKWVKGVAIGIGIFFALAGAIKAVIAVLTVVNALATMNPIGLIIVGVVAAIAAISALVYWAEELVAWFESIPQPIQAILMILNPLIALLYGFVKVVAFIKENWRDMWNGVVQAAEDAINYLLQNGPISWMIAAGYTLAALWPSVKKSAISAWSSVVKFFESNWARVVRGFEKIKAYFGGFIDDVKDSWSPLTDFFSDLWDGIVSTFKSAVGSLMELISPVTDLFKSLSDAKDKVISDKIGKISFDALKVSQEAPVKETKQTNSLLDDILAESERLRNSTVESTNHQTSMLQKTMNANAAKTARIVNQRFIDVSAPFRHFLRAEGEAAASGAGFQPVTTSPHTTTQRFLEERSQISKTELTVRAGRGTDVEVTGGSLGPGLQLERTGAF